jgi:hypothetical protein
MKIAPRVAALALAPFVLGLQSLAFDWPPIAPEDLSMTSVKEQPGAPAVVLQREEIDDDMNNAHSVYERIKILTDAGSALRESAAELYTLMALTFHSKASLSTRPCSSAAASG